MASYSSHRAQCAVNKAVVESCSIDLRIEWFAAVIQRRATWHLWGHIWGHILHGVQRESRKYWITGHKSIPAPAPEGNKKRKHESLCSGSITRTDGCSHGRYRYRLPKAPILLRLVHPHRRESFGGLCSTASPLQAWLRKRDRISGDLCHFVDRNEQALPISFRSIRGS